MGIYAGDADSYKDFAELLDPIILEYHGLEDEFSHVSDMDTEKVDGTIDPNAPVLSTRFVYVAILTNNADFLFLVNQISVNC